ncbi:MAG: hypothetical protein ABJO88_18290 [Parasphingorhabdus sp.]
MAKVIDSSFEGCALTTGLGMVAGVKLRIQVGWKAQKYVQKQFASVEEIDAEVFRSGGRAAVGAIVGGVLTGGIGLIAGAAIGGRKRKTASYLIRLDDGEYIAFEEKDRNVMNVLDQLAQKQAVRKRLADSANETE